MGRSVFLAENDSNDSKTAVQLPEQWQSNDSAAHGCCQVPATAAETVRFTLAKTLSGVKSLTVRARAC
jgi:hypothetical protein